MFRKLRYLLDRKECYVIADAKDNSVTFSKGLCSLLDLFNLDQVKVYVAALTGTGGAKEYAFILNPKIDEPTQLADIMYNSKHKCIGFESLCPTVNRIFYDYGLPADSTCRLSVRKGRTSDGSVTYYRICNPSARK